MAPPTGPGAETINRKLDMSLDELIKSNRNKGPRGKPAGKADGGVRAKLAAKRAGHGNNNKGGSGNKPPVVPRNQGQAKAGIKLRRPGLQVKSPALKKRQGGSSVVNTGKPQQKPNTVLVTKKNGKFMKVPRQQQQQQQPWQQPRQQRRQQQGGGGDSMAWEPVNGARHRRQQQQGRQRQQQQGSYQAAANGSQVVRLSRRRRGGGGGGAAAQQLRMPSATGGYDGSYGGSYQQQGGYQQQSGYGRGQQQQLAFAPTDVAVINDGDMYADDGAMYDDGGYAGDYMDGDEYMDAGDGYAAAPQYGSSGMSGGVGYPAAAHQQQYNYPGRRRGGY